MNTLRQTFLDMVLPRIAVQPSDRTLDVGCGDGSVSRALAILASEGMVVGIDAAGDAIREARKLSTDFENILYIQAEAEEIPWQDSFFSQVVLINAAAHVHDAEAALRHVHRVMSPGARLWMVNGIAPATGSPEGPPRNLDAGELRELLSKLGMEEQQSETATTPDGVAIVLVRARKP